MDRSKLPYNKVLASTGGAALSQILIFILNYNGIDVSSIEWAITVLFTAACGYITPERTSVGGQLLARKRNQR